MSASALYAVLEPETFADLSRHPTPIGILFSLLRKPQAHCRAPEKGLWTPDFKKRPDSNL